MDYFTPITHVYGQFIFNVYQFIWIISLQLPIYMVNLYSIYINLYGLFHSNYPFIWSIYIQFISIYMDYFTPITHLYGQFIFNLYQFIWIITNSIEITLVFGPTLHLIEGNSGVIAFHGEFEGTPPSSAGGGGIGGKYP